MNRSRVRFSQVAPRKVLMKTPELTQEMLETAGIDLRCPASRAFAHSRCSSRTCFRRSGPKRNRRDPHATPGSTPSAEILDRDRTGQGQGQGRSDLMSSGLFTTATVRVRNVRPRTRQT